MSIIRKLGAAFEGRGAPGGQPWGDSIPPPPSLVGANASGIPVTQGVAEGIAAVYACVGLLADAVSSLPVELRDGPIIRDSQPLPPSPLLKQPYAEISRRDWWVQFVWSLALRGNFFGRIIETDANGLPVQIKPIHPDQVQIWRDQTTGQLVYRFYGQLIPLSQVVHIRNQSSAGEILGLNPIARLALTFGTSVARERYAEAFFLNSANPMGVIQVPGYLDRAETRKMMRGWLSAHQGLNSANLPAVLTDGAEFKPITISPVDAQLLEAMQYSTSQICSIFRIPPHMISVVDRSTSWGRGIEQQARGFNEYTLAPYLTIGQESLTSYHKPGVYVHFDTTAVTRGATLERSQAAALLMNSGVAVADDLRQWFDWPDLPDGNGQQSFVPINTQLLEAALLALKQAKEAPNPLLQPKPQPQLGEAQPEKGQLPKGQEPQSQPKGKVARSRSLLRSSTKRREQLLQWIQAAETRGDREQAQFFREELGDLDNGHTMTEEEAWYIVEQAVAQAKRTERAAQMANDLSKRQGED